MFVGLLALRKLPRRFNDYVRAYRFPVDGGGIFFGKHLHRLAVDDDGITRGFDVVLEVAENRIVLEEMSQRRRAGQVVDGDEFERGIVNCRAHHVASYPAKTVDANFYRPLRTFLPSMCF